MSWVRRVTCSAVDLPRRKPACSQGSCGSMTGSSRVWCRRSRNLQGTHRRAIGRYPFGSSRGLLGLWMAITLERRQILGNLQEWRHCEQKRRSYPVAFTPWFRMNSGWMLSSPGDSPDFRCFRAVFISSGENSPERLESTLGALHSLCTLLVVCLAKVLSAFGNRSFLTSVVAMEFAVMGMVEMCLSYPLAC